GHGDARGLIGGKAPGDVAFDVFHHDDGVADHDADGEDEAEQGERVDGGAEEREHRKGGEHRGGDGEDRDDRGAPALQEEEDDEDDQRDGDDERQLHLVDRDFHELGRIVDDLVRQPLG